MKHFMIKIEAANEDISYSSITKKAIDTINK